MLNIFIIDDSVLFRTKLTKEIESNTSLNVLGTANDADIAQKRLRLLKTPPDVIVLDVELPKVDGITYLKDELSKLDSKVIVCSSFATKYKEQAYKAGAYKVIDKSKITQELVPAMIQLTKTKSNTTTFLHKNTTSTIVAIGASTGGLEVLDTILTSLPAKTPPILIVQHSSRDIAHTFLPKLQQKCKITIKEAKHGEIIEPNTAYFAPYDKHLLIKKEQRNRYKIIIDSNNKDSYYKPSINMLFNSMAQEVQRNSTAFILTGMGNDGVEGIKNIKKTGGKTFAQDEQSCVVFGMPKVAINENSIDMVLTPKEIATQISLI